MDGQDDLDELMDEIEETHIPHLSNSKITKSSNSKRLVLTVGMTPHVVYIILWSLSFNYDSITSDIDNMIDELLSEDDKDTSDNHNIKSSWQQVSSIDNK